MRVKYNILGIDYGEKRVGCAMADGEMRLPLPYTVIYVTSRNQVLEDIALIVKKENVAEIVVGLPLNRGGEDTNKTKEVRIFINELREHAAIPVHCIDERFTSKISMGMTDAKRNKKGSLDKAASQMILERYLALRGTC